jgi:hypothetical protein
MDNTWSGRVSLYTAIAGCRTRLSWDELDAKLLAASDLESRTFADMGYAVKDGGELGLGIFRTGSDDKFAARLRRTGDV